jgi:hypothetical protein
MRMADEQQMTGQPLPLVTEEPKVPVPSVTDEQIQEIALGLHRRQIFCDRHISSEGWEETVARVFRLLGLAGFGNINPKTVGLVWERFDKAGPRSFGDFPQFLSHNLLNIEDAEKVLDLCRKLRDAEQAVLGKVGG